MGRKGEPNGNEGIRGADSAAGHQNLIWREVTGSVGSMRLGSHTRGETGVRRTERSPIGSFGQQNPRGRLAGVLIKVQNHSDAPLTKSG